MAATDPNALNPRLAELIHKAATGLSHSEKTELKALIEDLCFETVSRVDSADEMPISGLATFCGVLYAFQRISAVSLFKSWIPAEPCFELRPLDPKSGLTMHAMGSFRTSIVRKSMPSVNGSSELQVRWCSLGPVGLTDPPGLRARFTKFLIGLADGTCTAAHWDAFAVNHYPDELVENIRRDCVRMLLGRGANVPPSEAERQQLRIWAEQLSHSPGPADDL